MVINELPVTLDRQTSCDRNSMSRFVVNTIINITIRIAMVPATQVFTTKNMGDQMLHTLVQKMLE